MHLLQSVIDINRVQPLRVIDLLKKHLGSLDGRKIAIMGLAFKPGTDDMRESPSIPIVQALHNEGATLSAFDPIAIDEARHVFANIDLDYAESVSAAIDGADAVVIVDNLG